MGFPAGAWPSSKVTDAIVAAIGSGNAIDRDEMRAGLHAAFVSFFVAHHNDADNRADRRATAQAIADTAKKLDGLIVKDRFLAWHLAPIDDLRGMLQRVAADAERAANDDLLPAFDAGKKALFVRSLVPIYAEQFGQPGRGRSGPFVRFVQAALAAINEYLKLPTSRAFGISGALIQKAVATLDKKALT